MHNVIIKEKELKGKLIELLRTFTKKELSLFSDFVRSPFYNKEKILVCLLDELKIHYPDFKGANFNKEIIFKKIFPDKKYNDAVLRNTVSKLLTLSEKFLSVSNFINDDFNSRISLLRELRLKKLNKLFLKHKSETEAILKNINYKNENYFYKKYYLEDLSFRQEKDIHNSLSLLNEKAISRYHNLSNAFITEILKANAAIINSNRNIFGKNSDLILIDEIELHFKKNPDKLKENLYLKYYYNSIKLFETEDEKYFNVLSGIVKDDLEQLERTLRRDLLTLLTNYCYYKINKGELKFMKEQFRFFKLNIEKKMYLADSDFIPHILFMNVVTCGLDSGEFKWIKEFITNYNSELKEEHRNNIFNFSFALYHYRMGNYSIALEFASKIISDEMSYKHQLKSLYLKIFFDMNEIQSFYSHVDSYKHFLNNDKMLRKENKNVILNYILFAKKIFDLRSNPDIERSEIDYLRKKILNHKDVINKTWLLDAIDRI